MSTPGQRMAHDHHFLDDKFNAFADAARQGRLARFQLDDGIRRLRHHFWVEEEFVFSALAHSHPGPVMVMLREHGEIWDHLDELEDIVAHDEPDLELALTVFQALQQRLDQHGVTEDGVLYSVADDVLGPEHSDRVLNALASEMPSDWRSQMASTRV